ncbi:chaperone NapD [Shewanella dokdonensis]|uniref:Chaperone NapD n=1 Tax=Shewanella dokdonensis TaxID=712036 RepID=A0ABX8DDX0_9GAMM|nr:chaperone NapD [Shewanella dokdonensis]MCL1074584.1 chaperone NapD [Shewanella dokdonensis]QVK22401.1 chaperone NapD [Shewanella dokdonensis]
MQQATPQEYHITSLVIHAEPGHVRQVSTDISLLSGTEIHACTHEGKLVITIEGDDQKTVLDRVETINRLPGVLSSSLVYHQVETFSH